MLQIHRPLAALIICTSLAAAAPTPAAPANSPPPSTSPANLVQNPDFQLHPDNKPAGFDLTGNVSFRYLGDDSHGGPCCVALSSANTGKGTPHGSVSQIITGLKPAPVRWYRFTIRALPQENFAVDDDALDMKIEYFQGDSGFDGKIKRLYPIIRQQRKDLAINGDRHLAGAATWHSYQLDAMLPTPLIDRVRLSVEFDHGHAPAATHSQFLISEFSFLPIDGPAPVVASAHATDKQPANLIPIAGRFFYKADPNETTIPQRFDYTNADRLIYHDNRWSAPFANSMSAWLRAGDLDLDGNLVRQDRFIADNVTVSFDQTSMIIHTHALPNHPTGKFPGENPSYIQEKNATYYIPLNPKENRQHFATDLHNVNHALPMGPIGIAANGVVFFNPFDADSNDASNIMDYCCGHPAPDYTYHYHKYPICINSPWADEGQEHSPLLGWAFDGFPIYGPYASAGVLARDLKGSDALNEFNLHTDPDRGPHYQVTPGKFPYIIGGYWGTPDPRNSQRGPRPAGGPGNGPPSMNSRRGPGGPPTGGNPDPGNRTGGGPG